MTPSKAVFAILCHRQSYSNHPTTTSDEMGGWHVIVTSMYTEQVFPLLQITVYVAALTIELLPCPMYRVESSQS